MPYTIKIHVLILYCFTNSLLFSRDTSKFHSRVILPLIVIWITLVTLARFKKSLLKTLCLNPPHTNNHYTHHCGVEQGTRTRGSSSFSFYYVLAGAAGSLSLGTIRRLVHSHIWWVVLAVR